MLAILCVLYSIRAETRCKETLNVGYQSVVRGDVEVQAVRDGEGVQAALLDPARALRGGATWQWPVETSSTHTYRVALKRPCVAGGLGSDSRWIVTRVSFSAEGFHEFRLLIGGATVVDDVCGLLNSDFIT